MPDRLVIELPKGGYTPVFQNLEEPAPADQKRGWPVLRYTAALTALTALAVFLAAAAWWLFQRSGEPVPIAVLPFTNLSQNPPEDYFADGITNEIIRNLRRPLTQYTIAPVTALAPWSQSVYHGVSSKLERRFNNSLSFLSSFTYGKVINLQDIGINVGGTSADNVQNAYNLRAQRGLSDISVPLRFVFSGVWDLPFGTDRRFLGRGLAGRIAGPWQVTTIYSAQSGLPFTTTLSFDNANAGTTSWPNRVCDGKVSNPSIHRWFDTGCFVAPPAYHLETPVRISCLGRD